MSDLPEDPTSLPIFGGTDPSTTTRPPAHALAGAIGAARTNASVPTAASVSTAVLDWPDHDDASPAGEEPPGVAGSIDWKLVALLRSQASEQLTSALGDERGTDLDSERELGRALIQELLQSTAADRIHDGAEAWTIAQQEQMANAVFNALFGLGRLQPYVDDDTVENIIITGAANVWLEKTDGRLVRAEPVADSDAELLDFLAFIASRSEVNARSFSSVTPRLHMRLDGGSRLAAAAWVTAHPSVVIRRHRLRKITLDDLVGRNMLTKVQASLLSAAVKAGKSIVVAGAQGAGKTTMVRALCAEFEPHEKIGTFETEFELHLHELPEFHPIVTAWEARPGSGEIAADGTQAGEFTLDEALYDSFRFNLSRQIVGEVRGREVWAMIKAMESGTGSISTTHAANGEAAMRKLVTCAMEAGPHVTRDLATSKLAETIDLIVQVHLETTKTGDESWSRERWVSEIVHVTPGEEAKGYAASNIFIPNPAGGPALPLSIPTDLAVELARYGFDYDGFNASAPGVA
ncbi:CpaF family protein [Promicromonospora sp. Marseille-Q5078]